MITTTNADGGYSVIGRTPHTDVEIESASPGTKWSKNQSLTFQNMDNTIDKNSYANLSKGQKTFLANECQSCDAATKSLSEAGGGAVHIFNLIKSTSHNPHVPNQKIHIDRVWSANKVVLVHCKNSTLLKIEFLSKI